LTSVYQNVKSISKPGETYQIAAIEFKPSLNDIQQVQSQLRERLYQQANDELARINKIYTGQHFTLNNLVFVEGDDVSEPRIALQARGMVNAVVAGASIPTLTVSNELTMKAMVEVASNRQQGK
jgi:predicted acylesterase/phospholipase RssA